MHLSAHTARGSLHAFAQDDVSIPIRPITARRSLAPLSCSRIALCRLCSLLSPKGAIRVSHVPLAEVRRVRCLLSTGRHMGHESAFGKRCSHLRCRFGSSVIATCACSELRSLSQIQMFSPYRLSGTHPACGCQKGTPLAIDTPHLAMLRYIVRVALYSDS